MTKYTDTNFTRGLFWGLLFSAAAWTFIYFSTKLIWSMPL